MNICAPFAGIVRYHVAAGQVVEAGQGIATVEATKLESPVATPWPGVVTSLAHADFDDVHGGDVLAVVGASESGAA